MVSWKDLKSGVKDFLSGGVELNNYVFLVSLLGKCIGELPDIGGICRGGVTWNSANEFCFNRGRS